MKVLALHLPQYHRICENDRWWGEGFTDWVNVKKAKPLFHGHEQPLIPLNHKYYDMTDLGTLKQQFEVSREYGIYGFCYYHYWFNGKLLLEKPCELLLKHTEIGQKFCFCWANESWARTWDGKEHDILIKQEYGGREDWEKHFDYLLNFFQDSRYIKIANKPLLFIYSCNRLKQFDAMIAFWRQRAIENGFDGLYIAEFVNSFNSGQDRHDTDIIVEFEPLCTARYSISNLKKLKRLFCKKTGKIDFLDYDYVWECLLNSNRKYDKKLWRSAFVGFDNSPRKGNKSLIIRGATPEKFKKYLTQMIHSDARDYDDSFMVINAWNEWAEGAILEPCENWGYGYLDALKQVLLESGKLNFNQLST